MGVVKGLFLFVCLATIGRSQSQKKPVMACDFEDGICPGWESEDEEFNWEIKSGRAKKVGPKYDHTRGNKEGSYLYLDDKGGRFGKAIIRSPAMDLTTPDKHCLRFMWFARGSGPGELRIYHSLKKSGRTVSLFFRSGSRSMNSTHWMFEDISVPKFNSDSSFKKVYFRFQAIKGRGEDNVIAIDDVTVTKGSCPEFQFPKTATTATFSPLDLRTIPGAGGDSGEELTEEELKERNRKINEENEKRNRELQEKNAQLNSGNFNTTRDPSQPTQPTQPTQPQQTKPTVNPAVEQRRRVEEDQRKRAEEEEKKQKAAIEEQLRKQQEEKEKIEKERIRQEEALRKQQEEELRRQKELEDKEKIQRLRKEKEQAERRAISAQKKREAEERKEKERADKERKEREEEERLKREEAERKRQEDEEKKRKEEERAEKRTKPQKKGKGKRGGKRRRRKGGKKIDKSTNPNYESCGDSYAHRLKELCCDGMPKRKSLKNSACCGSTIFNSKRKGCCTGKLYDLKGTMGCCGVALYSTEIFGCCAEVLYVESAMKCIDGAVVPSI